MLLILTPYALTDPRAISELLAAGYILQIRSTR